MSETLTAFSSSLISERYDLAAIGPRIEHDPLFPERVNVSLAQVLRRNAIRLVVWERGVGLTRACGTAACAAACRDGSQGPYRAQSVGRAAGR